MPRSNRFVRYLSIVFDRDAGRRLKDDAEAALEKAGIASAAEFEGAMKVGGQKGARALTTSLQREYKLRMARASQQLAEGAINERAFRREGEKAAREFNAGLSSGIKRLQTSTGGLTGAQFAGLGSRFKSVGAGGALAALRASPLLAPLGGFFAAREGLQIARTSIEAADELANSIRKLGGTAKITGLDLADLEREADKARETFKLSIPLANDLTTEVSKLAAKAGDIGKTSDAIASFLDIGAARGLTAAQTLQAVGQAILGIDEGTDKLFSKNPSTIYEEWANRIGRTAESLSDQEKAQALLDATLNAGAVTRGSYLEWLTTSQGKAAQSAIDIRAMQAAAGEAIQPFNLLYLELKLKLYEVLGGIVTRMGEFIEKSKEARAEAIKTYPMLFGSGGGPPVDAGGTWDAPERPGGFGRGTRVDLDAAAARMAAANPPRVLTAEEIAAAKAAAELAAKQRQQEIEKNILSLKQQSERLYGVRTGVTSPGAPPTGQLAGMLGVDTTGKTPMQQLGEDMERIDGIASDVAENVAGVWQDAFAQMIADGGNVGAFFDGMWRGVVASAGAALAEIATKEAAKEFAYAISMGAHALGFGAFGNLASAAAASGSATQHIAAALAWSAVAGGASAAGGAVRSRSPGSTHDAGLSTGRQTFDNGGKIAGEINIYINPLNPVDPAYQRNVRQATDFANERYPDKKINIKPYPGMGT